MPFAQITDLCLIWKNILHRYLQTLELSLALFLTANWNSGSRTEAGRARVSRHTVVTCVIIQAWRHQHSVVSLYPFSALFLPSHSPHFLPLPPPLLLPLLHHTDLLLHQRLAATGAQLKKWIGRESALLRFHGHGDGAKAVLRGATNNQIGGFHDNDVGGGHSIQACQPIREAADCRGEEAAPGGGAGGVRFQDDDIIGCHFMIDGSRKRR